MTRLAARTARGRALLPARLWFLIAVLPAGCAAPQAEPTAISLVERFEQARVEGALDAVTPPRIEWRFGDAAATPAAATGDPSLGWRAVHGVRGLRLRDGRLVGVADATALLTVEGPENPDPSDYFHAIEIAMRVSAGTRVGVGFSDDESLDEKRAIRDAEDNPFMDFNKDLQPGEELRTYTITSADASFNTSVPLRDLRHILIRPTDAAGASFEIASVRVVSLKEHLASVPSGIGWQGLGDVFRETIVSRAPERITFDLDLPSDPFLDLSIGTFDHAPITFEVDAVADGASTKLLRRTLSKPQQWHAVPVDLKPLAGKRVSLCLSLVSERPGTVGFWGAPVVRNRAGRAAAAAAVRARSAVLGKDREPPQGVILIIADTLRRDQFQPYGYERPNAPTLTRLAREGALFRDAIAQGAWTKVSVSSIITSLYPTTHGIKDMPDRLPAGVTTLAEAYKAAGYATFATSSVPFTGRLTNLHQGVEVLHESTSVPKDGYSGSKTSRTYVDRLLDWVEIHRDVPFFAFLHVFDPHSPFEPYRPWASQFMSADEMSAHRKDIETVRKFIVDEHMRRDGLPTLEEIRKSGVDVEAYVRHERAWYDASIKAMDVEIGRLLERLHELGLADTTLIAFMSDHGEEFLEHGRHFHGRTTYGEMLNVPLFLWWPGALPAGVEVDRTVEAIDMMPTLLEISRVAVPSAAQGQSLLPLLAGGGAADLGWRARPAFAERAWAPAAFSDEKQPASYHAVVVDGWKLIHNVERPDARPEFELYDHANDPLNLVDVASVHPEVVERLKEYLDTWQQRALAARVDAEAAASEMSSEEIEKLRALGYLN